MDANVNVTYNARLIMSDEDFGKMGAFLTQASIAYNECAKYLDSHNTPLDIKTVHSEVYDWMRQSYDKLPAQCIIRIYKDVIGALRSIRSNKHEDAKLPEKKNLSIRLDKRLYSSLSVKSIALTGFEKNKRKMFSIQSYTLLKEMFLKYTTADPLLFIRNGQPWISITFNVPQKPLNGNEALGVDLGLKRFVVTSDGIVIDDKAYKTRRRKTRYLKKCLKSKGTKSAKRHLKRLKHKERNQSKAFMMKAANAIIKNTGATYIVLEDLKGIKKNTSKTDDGFKCKKHNNMMSQVPLAEFKEILTYKALLASKKVITVSPKWTSQTDSRTGKRDGIRKGCRYYCSDGTVLDADWNAAVNIARRSNHPLSNVLPKDGRLQFLNGRALSIAHTHGSINTDVQAAKSLV